MTLEELKTQIKIPIFSRNDVAKLFPQELGIHINTQLYRMEKRGVMIGVKRGFYAFPNAKIDEFVIANKLFAPSYVSLESVLNLSGIMPDVPVTVTSIATVTSRKITTPLGNYTYSKIAKSLFFGFKRVLDEQSGLYYDISTPEKALLDYIYIRRIKNLDASRIDMSDIDKEMLFSYAAYFPKWVRKVLKNA